MSLISSNIFITDLGSVMCSSLPGCGSYDLGNTTLADCCGRSTVGLFYTLLGTEDCSPCDDGEFSLCPKV